VGEIRNGHHEPRPTSNVVAIITVPSVTSALTRFADLSRTSRHVWNAPSATSQDWPDMKEAAN
jgi:hypothetical protein